jgi:rod shape determining protein RodA
MLKLSDQGLWLSAGSLILIGFMAIFSATYRLQVFAGGDPFIFVNRQFFSLLAALLGLAVFTYLDYKHLKKIAPWLYGFTLLLLLLVLFGGSATQGAQRWLQIGFFSFQPSEISKLSLIVAVAVFLSERRKINHLWEIIGLLLLIGIPFFLVFKQPDLGTALVFWGVLLGILTASESSLRLLIILVTPLVSILLRPLLFLWLLYLFCLALGLFLTRSKVWDWLLVLGANIMAGVAFPFIWQMLKSYQRQRIVAFLNPAADPFGAGYHTLQSKIAIGGGGLLGTGWLRGSQTQLHFIPEQHSDFIFSVIGEEFGFVGAALVLLLFAILIWRTMLIACQARDFLGKMLAYGIAALLIFHVLANMGMAVGILPVVGIPLPFMSFGGSSLFMNLAAVGILQSISMRRQKLIF